MSNHFLAKHRRQFVMPNGQPARRPYEFCALSTLRDKLRSGDIYRAHGRRYTDPETFLIPSATWPKLREEVCQQLDLDATGEKRLSHRARELRGLLPRVDQALDRQEDIRMENGELIVPMEERDDLPGPPGANVGFFTVRKMNESIPQRIT